MLWAWGYAHYGTLHAAVAAYRRGDVERTRALLAEVPDAARLTPQSRAYYHWLKGALSIHDGQLEAPKPELELAVQGQLRTENDRCLIYCQLTELALLTKEFPAAREYLQQAQALRHRPPVEGILQALEARLVDAESAGTAS